MTPIDNNTIPKYFIIANPIAGGGKVDNNWNSIIKKLTDAKISFDFAKTKHSHSKHIVVNASSSHPVGVEVDGEDIGETPVKFSIIKKGLKIISP